MTFSFWLILLAVLAYGLLHSLLASLKVKDLTRRWKGPSIEQWYRLIFNYVALITLLPILLLPILLTDKRIYTIPFPWLMVSMSIQLLAFSQLIIGLHQTGIKPFLGLEQLFSGQNSKPSSLVTSGLYRYMRHPLYTAGLLIIWLTPLMTWNILAIVVGLTIYIFIGINLEERKLLNEFGNAYAEYRSHTAMLIPGLYFASRKQNS